MRSEKGTLSDIAAVAATRGDAPPAEGTHEWDGKRHVTHPDTAEVLALAGAALDLAATAATAARYARGAKAASTRRAYELDWRDFTSWCAVRGLAALPAEPTTVSFYLADSASRLKPATIARRLVTIGVAHDAAGLESPCGAKRVREVWAGIQRAHGTAPVRKTPLVLDALRACLLELGDSLRDDRDRALLLVGFAGALRRSEIVALDVDDLEWVPEGIILHIRRSKTDPLGAGRVTGIPIGTHEATSPTLALQRWLLRAGIQRGAIWRGVSSHDNPRASRLADKQVARIVKRVCDAAGLQGDYSGHSLRAGLATTAAAAGASEAAIMAQTGHKSLLIARSYIRPASLFAANAAAIAGL
jgi:integrase